MPKQSSGSLLSNGSLRSIITSGSNHSGNGDNAGRSSGKKLKNKNKNKNKRIVMFESDELQSNIFEEKKTDDASDGDGNGNTNSNGSGSSNGSSSGFGLLSKLSAFRFGSKQKNIPIVEEEELPPDDDPVMALFQSRCKNRVRFSLELEMGPTPSSPQHSINSTATSATAATTDTDCSASPETTLSTDAKLGEEKGSEGERETEVERGNAEKGTSSNLKSFMKGALFGPSKRSEEFEKQAAKEVKDAGMEDTSKSLVWESSEPYYNSLDGPEVVHTGEQLTVSFTEKPETRKSIVRVLSKARRAQFVYFRYEHAVKYFVKALDLLTKAQYPENHPTVTKTLRSLNNAHHALSSYNNSANIVKMGIKYEDSGELVRALKMYSIAYRIRRDNLSPAHPSLVVLLNMLGSIQIKRGDFEEAMQIYQLALKDTSRYQHNSNPEDSPPSKAEQQYIQAALKGNLLAKSVTYREMGSIYEKWGNHDKALKMYHKSLDCVAEWKASNGIDDKNTLERTKNAVDDGESRPTNNSKDDDADIGNRSTASNRTKNSTSDDTNIGITGDSERSNKNINRNNGIQGNSKDQNSADGNKEENSDDDDDDEDCINSLRVTRSIYSDNNSFDYDEAEKGEMEVFVTFGAQQNTPAFTYYDSFFPQNAERTRKEKQKLKSNGGRIRRDDYADIDVALTIHQIAQLHRKQGEYNVALEAYAVSLRGMKFAVGNNHPNVAAILGNIGNLQKEMGDLDAAYNTYQEVLGIESYRLGLSHPDVAITLHNIATIDAARGNFDRSLTLYRQVLTLQEKLFGKDHGSVAVTAACMGDVYEQIGDMKSAMEAFEESLRIKSAIQGHHSLEVARMLHKLAKVAFIRHEFRIANSFVSRAILVYRLNKVSDDHEWAIDAHRDSADIDAAIAMSRKMTFEC